MPATNYVALTADLLRAAGWVVERVDHRHPFANRWVDFLGVADLLAYGKRGEGLMLVQLTGDAKSRTASGNLAKRRTKLLASDKARLWVESGGRLCLVGWLRAPKGETGLVAHVEEITLRDFPGRADSVDAAARVVSGGDLGGIPGRPASQDAS